SRGDVSAPIAAPATPPITAPEPMLPDIEPIAAPAPAPSRPPDSALSPGLVPQLATRRLHANVGASTRNLTTLINLTFIPRLSMQLRRPHASERLRSMSGSALVHNCSTGCSYLRRTRRFQ